MSGSGQRVKVVVKTLDGLVKLKQTALLTLSGYTAFLVGGGVHRPLHEHLAVLVLSYASIAAVTAINMYFDRDIDALMPRTMGRPLAAGMLSPGGVLAAAAVVLAASVLASIYLVNIYFAAAILLGFVFDIVAYTLLLKRRTPLNIVAGAIAGGAPALGGWAAATGAVDVNALLFSLLVVSWVPPHIWFLATYFRDDYRAARIPMLPAVTDHQMTAVGIGLGSVMMAYSVAGLYLTGAIGLASLAYSLAASIHIFALAVGLSTLESGHREYAWKAFRIVNMHLGMSYLIMILEKALAA